MIRVEATSSPLGSPKIGNQHRERLAVVYVRQSSVHQVQQHQESTRLQYGLVDHAHRLGWPRPRIIVIDDDLGISGAGAEARLGFQRLLSEVALEHVGLILGVETSRLARSCKDWYQLLELCALFGTLICDVDGVYDPSCYNDRLLLGLKGTMSEAELHILQQRMQQGALHKAQRGELVSTLPIGYIRPASGEVMLDPDEQAQFVVRLVFEQFERIGTMNGVLRYLVQQRIQLPVRPHSGPCKGQLQWRRPSQATLRNLLTHPTYAGAYVYGRTCQNKKTRQQKHQPRRLPPSQWRVLLWDHYPAYISRAQYERNQAQLAENRSLASSRGATRQGRALLAGFVVCARCGFRLGTQYVGPANQPRYSCAVGRASYGGPNCQSLVARARDEEVVRLALLALAPSSLEVSLQVAADLESQRAHEEQHWRQRLERAQYEADRARRPYEAVEPENRLVARTLETNWEEKLRAERELVEQYERFTQARPRRLAPEEREQIHRLASDVPRLWEAPSTTDIERKEVLRQIIDQVVVNVEEESEWVEAWVYWAGGHQTYTRFRRPVARLEQLGTWSMLRQRVRELKTQGCSAPQIAEHLEREGMRSTDGKPFTAQGVRTLLSRYGLAAIKTSRRDGTEGKSQFRTNEWLIPELTQQLGVNYRTIYGWIQRGWIKAQKSEDHPPRWIVQADSAKLRELMEYQRQRNERQERRQQSLIAKKA